MGAVEYERGGEGVDMGVSSSSRISETFAMEQSWTRTKTLLRRSSTETIALLML